MILGDLLDSPVHDENGGRVGVVIDVRLVLDGPVRGLLAAPRLLGLLVAPRRVVSFLGYERTDVTRPALLAHWLRHRARGTVLVPWEDVLRTGPDGIVLRAGYRGQPPTLPR